MPSIPSDIWSQIMAFEAGRLPDSDVIPLFQYLIDERHAWRLQGFYGRIAHQLIDDGLRTRPLQQPTKGMTT